MLETFFRTHQYLVEHTDAPVRRALMDEINWRDRLIGIKGSRGVGKTTLLKMILNHHHQLYTLYQIHFPFYSLCIYDLDF